MDAILRVIPPCWVQFNLFWTSLERSVLNFANKHVEVLCVFVGSYWIRVCVCVLQIGAPVLGSHLSIDYMTAPLLINCKEQLVLKRF